MLTDIVHISLSSPSYRILLSELKMTIFQTVSRNSLLNYLDEFLKRRAHLFENKESHLYGKKRKVEMFLFNSINSRAPISHDEELKSELASFINFVEIIEYPGSSEEKDFTGYSCDY